MPILNDLLQGSVTYMRTGERLRFALHSHDLTTKSVQSIKDLEPDLAPEIDAALEHLKHAEGALMRAFDAVTAIFEVEMQKLQDRLLGEGGGS